MLESGFGANAALQKTKSPSCGLKCSVFRSQSMIMPKRCDADRVNFVFFMIGAEPVARKFTRTFRPTGRPRREAGTRGGDEREEEEEEEAEEGRDSEASNPLPPPLASRKLDRRSSAAAAGGATAEGGLADVGTAAGGVGSMDNRDTPLVKSASGVAAAGAAGVAASVAGGSGVGWRRGTAAADGDAF